MYLFSEKTRAPIVGIPRMHYVLQVQLCDEVQSLAWEDFGHGDRTLMSQLTGPFERIRLSLRDALPLSVGSLGDTDRAGIGDLTR